MNIISAIASKIIANKFVRVDECSRGLSLLNQCLIELEKSLIAQSGERNADTAAVLREGMADVIALAYKDFAAFSQQWALKICYWDHPEKTNMFTFSFTEKNDCPRSYEYKFTGLRRAV